MAEELIREIRKCKKCSLWKYARNAVPGEGPSDAKVMLVGQNPGEKEDISGKPFVGKAGKFLDIVLDKNDIKRERLFITNVVKHKTPSNRKPNVTEIQACMPYLIEQIRQIKPKFVSIGADSKGHGLPEPNGEKVRKLIEALELLYKIEVKIKSNLKRLGI